MCSEFKKWTFVQKVPVSVSLNGPSNTVNICDNSVITVFVTHGENDAAHRGERERESADREPDQTDPSQS